MWIYKKKVDEGYWEEVGYWRKANQIHNWFVKKLNNGDDNQNDIYVRIDDIIKLMKSCLSILVDDDHEEFIDKFDKWKKDVLSRKVGDAENDWKDLVQLQSCQSYIKAAEKDDIDEVENVLKTKEDAKAMVRRAHSILPTQDGFFFGSTDYDAGYFSDIRSTIKILKKCVDAWIKDTDVEFQYSCWW